jgi:methionyl-tRNA synthetase
MVLAATSAAGKVELLNPPKDAKIGERVAFAGHASTPAEPNQMAKKKYFDTVAESLRVGDDLVANYKGIPFMTSAGPISVPSAKGGTIH